MGNWDHHAAWVTHVEPPVLAPSTAVTQITAAVLQHAAALSDPGLQVHCQILPAMWLKKMR